jgi:hypothetical protein
MEEQEFRFVAEEAVIVCPFCQAASDGELHTTIAAMLVCEHCPKDIEEDGEHTGFGDAILSMLSRRFGAETARRIWFQARTAASN